MDSGRAPVDRSFHDACHVPVVEVFGKLLALPNRTLESRIVTVNLLGCIAFGIAAVASYVAPSTETMINTGLTNMFTALGALCFLIRAVLLLPEGTQVPESVVASPA